MFEPNDPRIGVAAKVEYENPYSNAETILLMAAKRSLVSSVRRATGTSGLFTQDDDSPSVRAQAGDAFGDDGEAPKIENVPNVVAAAGGKEALASTAQLRELVALSQEKDLGAPGIAALINRLFGKTIGDSQKAVSTAAKALTGDEIGTLLQSIRTGEVPPEADEPDAPSHRSHGIEPSLDADTVVAPWSMTSSIPNPPSRAVGARQARRTSPRSSRSSRLTPVSRRSRRMRCDEHPLPRPMRHVSP